MTTTRKIFVGLLDSGLDGSVDRPVVAEARIVTTADGETEAHEVVTDPTGHGSRLAAIICHHAPAAAILNAQVFADGPATSVGRVAAGLDWLVSEGANVINMSFGLKNPHPLLEQACRVAVRSGVLLVASSPAQGEPVFPAAYAGVIGAAGDARCRADDLVQLDGEHVTFGACVGDVNHAPHSAGGGASLAAAHVSGHAARLLDEGIDASEIVAVLDARCRFKGREHRR